MSSQNPIDAESVRGANYTEALNQLLRVVKCPTKLHSFIHTLIGFADVKKKVAVFDAELGRRYKARRSVEAAAKWVQRNRRELNIWQDENSVYLIETKSGTKDKDGRPIPSRYYIHLTEYINYVLEEANKDQLRWDSVPHVAIEFAAQKFVRNMFTRRQVYGPPRGKTTDVDKIISQNLRSCITAIEKVTGLMEKKSDVATKEHRELWQELKGYISSANFHFEDEDEVTLINYIEEEDDDEDDEDIANIEPPYDSP